ncbi:hypothetical protein CQW23_18679 [Capsicum baccatum]|uniref:Uncharacterized protein n=1 Tax=Capsicum baccatum TaxID=33114 RepID=A0A2G2W3M4_CAPBA|nr:hypothetical protein CQW23_18679 [Capsicum baccatum]
MKPFQVVRSQLQVDRAISDLKNTNVRLKHTVNQLSCCNYGHYSNTYEPLIDVSLEIKDVDNLHSALESFSRVEKLDDPEISSPSAERGIEKFTTTNLIFSLIVIGFSGSRRSCFGTGSIYYVLCEERHTVVSDVSESNAATDETVQASNPGPTGVINSSDSHELNKLGDKELLETLQTLTPGLPSDLS